MKVYLLSKHLELDKLVQLLELLGSHVREHTEWTLFLYLRLNWGARGWWFSKQFPIVYPCLRAQ